MLGKRVDNSIAQAKAAEAKAREGADTAGNDVARDCVGIVVVHNWSR
jgi:hypothetical protein